MPLPQLPFSEILSRLEALSEYLLRLGFAVPKRLRRTITNFREIEQARLENRLKDLVASRRVAELVWSVVEGQQLAIIFEGFLDYEPETAIRLLLKGLKGPLHPIDEKIGSTSEGRNTLFELQLGALFRRAGASVTMGEEADLRIDHAGARLYVECKRPVFARTIPKNVAKARRQLMRRFQPEQAPVGGLVAISISKALNPGLKMFVVDDEDGLKQLGADVEQIQVQYGSDYDRQDLRLVGMLFHLFTPAYVRSTNRLVAAEEMRIFAVHDSLEGIFPLSGNPLRRLLQSL